jgi:hypothetical protein
VNIGDPMPDLTEAEHRVLVMQTKLHPWAKADPGCRFDDLANLAAAGTSRTTLYRDPISARSHASIKPVKPAISRRSSAPACETTPSPSAVPFTLPSRPLRFTRQVPFREVFGSFEDPHSPLQDRHFDVSNDLTSRKRVQQRG